MKASLKLVLAASLLLGARGTVASAQFSSGPVASNAFITIAGLDWAWADPCSAGAPGTCDPTFTMAAGWRFATASEFSNRPDASAFQDPNGNFYASGYGQMRCATPWFSSRYRHCDYNDGVSGTIASGPGVGSSIGYAETWVVRGESTPVDATPEPASLVLMGTGLLAMVGVARRNRRRNDA